LIGQGKRWVERLIAYIPVLFACTYFARPQTITVRLINGETGKPMKNFNLTLHWDKDVASSVVFIGAEGVGHADILPGARDFTMLPGPKMGKEPYRIAFIDCTRGSLLTAHEALEKGIVPENWCSSKTLKPKPGEVIFWGRPRHFWEPDLQ
jgi:hypothetical protein